MTLKISEVKAKLFNLQAYVAQAQRMREVETEKAFMIKISRHESSGAGGPK
jgi:hypothetical protein